MIFRFHTYLSAKFGYIFLIYFTCICWSNCSNIFGSYIEIIKSKWLDKNWYSRRISIAFHIPFFHALRNRRWRAVSFPSFRCKQALFISFSRCWKLLVFFVEMVWMVGHKNRLYWNDTHQFVICSCTMEQFVFLKLLTDNNNITDIM